MGAEDAKKAVAAAKKAHKILIKGMRPTDIAVTTAAESCHLRVNTNSFKAQNVKIDPNLFFLMTNGEVI